MKKKHASTKTKQTQTYPLRALPESKTEAEVTHLGTAPVIVSTTSLLQPNQLLDEGPIHSIAKLVIPEASNVLEAPYTHLLGTSVSGNVSLRIKPSEVYRRIPDSNIKKSTVYKSSHHDPSETSGISATTDFPLNDRRSPYIDVSVPEIQKLSDLSSLKSHGFEVASTSNAFPERSAPVNSIMRTMPNSSITDLLEPGTYRNPYHFQETASNIQQEDNLSESLTEALLASVDLTAIKASFGQNKCPPISSVRFYTNAGLNKTESSRRNALLTNSVFGMKSTDTKPSKLALTDNSGTDQVLNYKSATNDDLESDANTDLLSASIELFKTSPERYAPKWISKTQTESDSTFKLDNSKPRLQSEAAAQSYLESRKFFGSLGSSSIGRSTKLESTLPITHTERLYSILRNRPDSYSSYRSEVAVSANNSTHNDPRLPASPSRYSAVTSLRRFSNPFMVLCRTNESDKLMPASASKNGKSPRGTPLKAHFAGEQNGTPELEEMLPEDSISSISPFQESWENPGRQRYKSIVSRITTNQEFMRYPATSAQPETGTYYE